VAQAVGVDPAVDPGLAREARQQAADIAGVQSPASQRAEDRRPRARGELAATIKPPGQQRGGLLVDANRAGLVALAVAHPDGAGLKSRS